MIDFRLVADVIEYRECDTLMFTSKQAVVSAERIDPTWKSFPAIAIGGATAAQIEKIGGTVLYHPAHFYGKKLAEDILSRFRERRVLYLRPRTVSFDSRGFLHRAGYTLDEQIIYETFCRPHPVEAAPPSGSIIIFTSPSTIHCFLGRFAWEATYTAVVIGTATLEHLPSECDFRVADTPLIDACIAKALETRDSPTT
jgi:uroporphyrinogen-III synthase